MHSPERSTDEDRFQHELGPSELVEEAGGIRCIARDRLEHGTHVGATPLTRAPNETLTGRKVCERTVERGELTLRGQTRPVVFQVQRTQCATPGRGCPIAVTGKVSRHAFGMNAYRWSVRDQVEFEFRVRLAQLMEQRSGGDMLKSLQEWCHEAEASGIRALQEFSARLKGYSLAAA